METQLTPRSVRDKALAARVPLSAVLDRANVPSSTFYRWEAGGDMRDLTKARIWDALQAIESGT